MAGRGAALVQLSLVGADAAPGAQAPAERQVFEHWVYLMGKNARRTVLGPERRRALRRALELYDVDTLMLAIEGCAGSAWHRGENDRGMAYDDLELILRNERNVERFAELGERVREQARRMLQRRREAEQAAAQQAEQAAQGADGDAPVPEDAATWREAVRAMTARMAGRG